MNKLTSIRIKQNDGTYSDDIPIQVLAENVSWILDSSISLLDILGDVKYTTKGSIQHQLDTFSLDEIENARVGADDTQYQNLKARLDGEYEDLQDAIAAVATNLQTETGTRSNADAAIRTDLSSETTARINGDNLLSSQITAEVNARKAAISAETSARASAINSEITARDNAINSAIATEITNRSNAINAEASARQTAISAEANARANADATLQNNIDVERARIDQIASLPSGSTSGDAELLDIRVGTNGITYSSAGNAVRSQFSNLNKLVDGFYNATYGYTVNLVLTVSGVWSSGGTAIVIPINSGENATIVCQSNKYTWYTFASDPHIISGSTPVFASGYSGLKRFAQQYNLITAPNDAKYLIVVALTSNGNDDYTPTSIMVSAKSAFQSIAKNLSQYYFHCGPMLSNQYSYSNVGNIYKDLKNIPINEYCVYTRDAISSITSGDVPYVNGFGILTLGSHNFADTEISGKLQFAIAFGTAEFVFRTLTYNGSTYIWSNWSNFTDIDTYKIIEGIYNAIDIYNLPIHNCVINYDGNLVQNQYTTGYSYTDYIPVKFGDIVHLAYVQGRDLNGGALYDSNKNFVKAIWGTDDWKQPSSNISTDFEFVIDDPGIKYIRYNINKNSVFPLTSQYLWITPNIPKNWSFHVGPTRGIKTILEAANFAAKQTYSGTVYVDADTYDLTAELAQNLVEYDGDRYSHGIQFGNNVHWVFAQGAKLTFNYDGSNTDVAELFSPLVISGSCILENLDIEVKNCQYCIHDDWPDRESNWIVKYINCNMKHSGNTVGTYNATVCIGGGLLPNELVIIEGGTYECPLSFNYPISYHTIYSDFGGIVYPSKIIIKGTWISGGVRFADAPYTSSDVLVEMHDNSLGTSEGERGSMFTIKAWNNEFRNN